MLFDANERLSRKSSITYSARRRFRARTLGAESKSINEKCTWEKGDELLIEPLTLDSPDHKHNQPSMELKSPVCVITQDSLRRSIKFAGSTKSTRGTGRGWLLTSTSSRHIHSPVKSPSLPLLLSTRRHSRNLSDPRDGGSIYDTDFYFDDQGSGFEIQLPTERSEDYDQLSQCVSDSSSNSCTDDDDDANIISVIALCKSQSKSSGPSDEQLLCRYGKFSLDASLTEVAAWFSADSKPLDTFTLNHKLFQASTVTSISTLLGSECRPQTTGLVICIGPVQNEAGEVRLAYSISLSPLSRIKTFAASIGKSSDSDSSGSQDHKKHARLRKKFIVKRKLGPREMGWVDPFDWVEADYDIESDDGEDWLKPRGYYGAGQRKTSYEWKAPRKLGPRDIDAHNEWKEASYKDALPNFMENFLKPRPSYVRKSDERPAPKKHGPRETGIAKGFVPYVGGSVDNKCFLEEKYSFQTSARTRNHVPRKKGPRQIGRFLNFIPYTGWRPDDRHSLEEKVSSTSLFSKKSEEEVDFRGRRKRSKLFLPLAKTSRIRSRSF